MTLLKTLLLVLGLHPWYRASLLQRMNVLTESLHQCSHTIPLLIDASGMYSSHHLNWSSKFQVSMKACSEVSNTHASHLRSESVLCCLETLALVSYEHGCGEK